MQATRITLVTLLLALSACSTDSTRPDPAQAQVAAVLKALGTDMCDVDQVHVSHGDVERTFRREYGKWGCSESVYWYEYVHVEDGRSYAWCADIDRLNASLRLKSDNGEIRRIKSGPNILSDTPPADIPTFEDDRYKSGATRPTEVFDAASIAGTTWDAVDSFGRTYVFEFIDDGTAIVRSANRVSNNATWWQEASTVFIEVNDGYIERYGTIRGRIIEGNTWNKTGARWTWTAKKREAEVY